MDYQSLKKYEGKKVRLTLINSFWYRAKVISVSEKVVEFLEEKGKHLTISPEAVMMLEDLT